MLQIIFFLKELIMIIIYDVTFFNICTIDYYVKICVILKLNISSSKFDIYTWKY